MNATLPERMLKSSEFDNFDTTISGLIADAYMCPRCEGLHEEPLMYSQVVLFVQHHEVEE